MDTRHFKLTDDATRDLEKAELASKDVEERRHLQAVRLYGMGEPLASILNAVQASERTLRRWATRYRKEGLAGLRQRPRPGNHRRLTCEAWTAVGNVLRQATPTTIGLSERPHWTVTDGVELVKDRYGVEYVGRSRYHALWHAAGLSYQRATNVYRHKPRAVVISAWQTDTEKK